jgi:lipopolysaccharide heptosyltransferase I
MADYRQLRILITRLSAIGDCILTVPVLAALREHLPRAFIAWAVERPAAPLLDGHAALNELIVLPRGWLKSPTWVWQLRRRLRREQFDVVVDPQSLTKSALVGWLSGARQRIGFDGPDGRELSKRLNNQLVPRTASHVVDRSLQLLKPLGIKTPEPRFDLPEYGPAVERVVANILHQHNLHRFAILNVGAGWPSKIWPAQRYAAVADHLGSTHGLSSLVVWAGEQEHDRAREVAATCPDHAIVAPTTSLTELATLLRCAALFVGSDTGPLHLAAAVGTPCIGLYGPTLPAVCGPYGSAHVAIQKYHQDGSCRERRKADNHAMQAISSADVCSACDQALAANRGPHEAPGPSQSAA